jgi:predicted membrane metal-binding protein
MAIAAAVVLEIFELVPGTTDSATAKIHISHKVKKRGRSLQYGECDFAFFQIYLAGFGLFNFYTITDTANKGSDTAKIKHQVHRHIESIFAGQVNLFVQLGSGKANG